MSVYDSQSPPVLLEINDVVIFEVEGHWPIMGRVESMFLDVFEEIFIQLKLDSRQSYALASQAYGYQNQGGRWPACKHNDMAALTRLVNVLLEMTEIGKERPEQKHMREFLEGFLGYF